MSKGAQHDLAGDRAAPNAHLTKRFPGESPAQVATPINDEREYYCKQCIKRVTRGPNGEHEYGHARECSHSKWRDGDG